jgi:hypothetical protein
MMGSTCLNKKTFLFFCLEAVFHEETSSAGGIPSSRFRAKGL